MGRRAGLQTEVGLSLALVMGLASVVLAGVLSAHHEASLGETLGRALLAEAHRPEPWVRQLYPGTDWWTVDGRGQARARGPLSAALDEPTLALAGRAARQGVALIQPGPVWDRIRFAAPRLDGAGVWVARLPRDASWRLRVRPLVVTGGIVGADLAVFGLLGVFLLRRRVVRPLAQLAEAVRELAQGGGVTRVAVEGARETVELASAFNDMADALSQRTRDLEKAVEDLRTRNQQLRRARAGLDRAQRLAAVGHLAAGVAHEVGNPIGAILAFLELAGRDGLPAELRREHLARAAQEGERVRCILRQLLDFSRPSRCRAEAIDLAAVAEQTADLLTAQRRYAHIHLEWERSPAPRAWGDPAIAGQILLNLLLNAAAAVEGCAPARIQLCVRPASLWRRQGENRPPAGLRAEADAVECVVSDNGCGIPEADRERIFDAFFTTRPPGEGTGLGLANAARQAAEQDGCVELVEPAPGFTTAFALRLPCAGTSSRAGVRRAGR